MKKTFVYDVMDIIKGEAASAASSILVDAAKDLESYASKKVTSGSEGVKSTVGESETARSFARDIGLGGVPVGTIAAVGLGIVVLFILMRR